MINNMKPEVVLKLKYKEKETEDYMKEKMAEYYTMYPEDEKDSKCSSEDYRYRSRISDYEERCKKIRDAYNNRYNNR